MSYTPKTIKLQGGGPLQTFLEPSTEVFDATQYSPEEAARIQRHLDNRYTLYDAQNNATEKQALHTMLLKDDPDGPTNSEVITVDVPTVAAELAKSEKYSGQDKERWTRTLALIDNIQKKDISIVKDDNDRYWLEDNSTGVRKYSANAIAEVRELLIDFGGVKEKPVEDESGKSINDGSNTSGGDDDIEDKLISDLVPDEYKGGFNSSERWALAAIATDVGSSVGGLIAKMTGVGAPVGSGISAVGGIGATFMDMYSDYLDKDVTAWEMAGNAAVRIGLEAAEAVSFLPVSLMSRLQKGNKYGKILRKAVHYGMAGGLVNTAVGMEWNELLDKISEGGISDLEIDDWRRLGAMAQFTMSFGATLHTKGQLKKQLNTANTKANTGDLGTVKAPKVKGPKTGADTPKVSTANKAGIDNIEGTKPIKNTTAQRANIREIKKEIAPPKKITPKRDALIERAMKPVEAAASTNTIKANKQALSNNKAMNLERQAAIDKIDKRFGAEKRGIATDKINKEFDTRSTVLNKTSDTKVKNIADKVEAKKEAYKKKITDRRNIKGSEIKAKRDKEVAKKVTDRKNKLIAKETEAKELFGTEGGKKMIKKSREKVLGKKGEEQIKKAAPKTDAEKRIVKAETQISKLKAKKPKIDEKKPISKTNSKLGKQSSLKDRKRIKELKAQIAKDKEIVKQDVIRSKKLVAKSTKKIKEAADATKKGFKITKAKIDEGVDKVLFSIATKDGVSSKSAIKGLYASYKADREEGRQTQITTIKKKLKDNGYKVDEKYSDKDIRTAYKKLMKNIEDANKKQLGGKLIMKTNSVPIRKAQSGLTTMAINYGPAVSNAVKSFFSYLYKNSTIGGIAPSTGAGVYNLGSGRSTGFDNGVNTPIIGLSKMIENAPALEKERALNLEKDKQRALAKAEWDKRVAAEGNPSGIIGGGMAKTPEERLNDLTNVEIALQAAAEEAAKNAKSEVEKQAVLDRYDEAISALGKSDPSDPNWSGQVGRLLEYVKPSDFIDGSRINVTRPVREDVVAPVLQTLGVDNMPGYDYAEGRGRLIPRVDTADSFASNVMAQKFHNQGIRNTNELNAKNAAFIENRRQSNLAVNNKNRAAVAAAENENARSTNRAEEIYANQYNQALTARDVDRNKRRGQFINGVSSYALDASRRLKEMDLTKQYNILSNVKNIWNSEYQPRIDAAVNAGTMGKVKEIKTEFIKNQAYDPDELDRQILDLRSQFKGLT